MQLLPLQLSAQPDTHADNLAALIATEHQLERLLEQARADAASRIARARNDAAEQEQTLRALVAAATDRVIASIEATTRARIERERASVAAEVARYQAVTGEALEALAARLVERLVELVRGGPP